MCFSCALHHVAGYHNVCLVALLYPSVSYYVKFRDNLKCAIVPLYNCICVLHEELHHVDPDSNNGMYSHKNIHV